MKVRDPALWSFFHQHWLTDSISVKQFESLSAKYTLFEAMIVYRGKRIQRSSKPIIDYVKHATSQQVPGGTPPSTSSMTTRSKKRGHDQDCQLSAHPSVDTPSGISSMITRSKRRRTNPGQFVDTDTYDSNGSNESLAASPRVYRLGGGVPTFETDTRDGNGSNEAHTSHSYASVDENGDTMGIDLIPSLEHGLGDAPTFDNGRWQSACCSMIVSRKVMI